MENSPRFAPRVSTMLSISPRMASTASSPSRGSASASARRSTLRRYTPVMLGWMSGRAAGTVASRSLSSS